jgi:hypothetical protein
MLLQPQVATTSKINGSFVYILIEVATILVSFFPAQTSTVYLIFSIFSKS